MRDSARSQCLVDHQTWTALFFKIDKNDKNFWFFTGNTYIVTSLHSCTEIKLNHVCCWSTVFKKHEDVYNKCVREHVIFQRCNSESQRDTMDPKRHPTRLAVHGHFISGIWQLFTRSKGVDPVYIMGALPVLRRHTPSCPWEQQSLRPVSKLTLLVNGAATSGRVSQPNKILIGELLGNSLIWPEGKRNGLLSGSEQDRPLTRRWRLDIFFGSRAQCPSFQITLTFFGFIRVNLWLMCISWLQLEAELSEPNSSLCTPL